LVTEGFKGSYRVNDIVYISISCGVFPADIGDESVFFTSSTFSSSHYRTQLNQCSKNGVVTPEERLRLRQGLAGTTCHVGGTTYFDGATWNKDCNQCTCTNGQVSCTKRDCSRCYTSSGVYVPEGSSVREDCNMCTCTNGDLICPGSVICTKCTDEFGGVHNENDIWTGVGIEGTCSRWMCSNGQIVTMQEGYDCTPTPPTQTASKFFVIGISMGAALLIVVIATIISIIRRRMRAQEAREDGEELDDAESDSASDDDVPMLNNTQTGGYAVNSSPYVPSYAQPAYPTYVPGWGGQPVATTPMVLMTQTGEPVVVQVAYM